MREERLAYYPPFAKFIRCSVCGADGEFVVQAWGPELFTGDRDWIRMDVVRVPCEHVEKELKRDIRSPLYRAWRGMVFDYHHYPPSDDTPTWTVAPLRILLRYADPGEFDFAAPVGYGDNTIYVLGWTKGKPQLAIAIELGEDMEEFLLDPEGYPKWKGIPPLRLRDLKRRLLAGHASRQTKGICLFDYITPTPMIRAGV